MSYGEIRMFGCSARARTRAERNDHVFDAPWQCQSTPRRSALRASRDARSRTHARAYKADQGLDRTPPLALRPAQAQVHRTSLCARCASGRPSPDHHGPATPALLHSIQSLG
jgi:hypothetical protein